MHQSICRIFEQKVWQAFNVCKSLCQSIPQDKPKDWQIFKVRSVEDIYAIICPVNKHPYEFILLINNIFPYITVSQIRIFANQSIAKRSITKAGMFFCTKTGVLILGCELELSGRVSPKWGDE
jgi:hypothetical protein